MICTRALGNVIHDHQRRTRGVGPGSVFVTSAAADRAGTCPSRGLGLTPTAARFSSLAGGVAQRMLTDSADSSPDRAGGRRSRCTAEGLARGSSEGVIMAI